MMKKLIAIAVITVMSASVWGQNQIGSSGNVGIGTTDPKATLHIDGNTNGWKQIIKGTVTQPNEFIGLKLNTGYPGELSKWAGVAAICKSSYGNSPGLALFTSNSEKLRILHNGNVGIGTSDPKATFHIDGNSHGWKQIIKGTVTQPNEFVGLKFNTGYPGEFSKWAGVAAVCKSSYGNSPGLGFYTANSEKVRILHNGNVGIGTDSPTAKLDVRGTIAASEIKVELIAANSTNIRGTLSADKITVNANGNTADFVFADDYNLRELSEVEDFITTNKHLPDVPSASTMEEEGVNLAEMNKLLLQKVEELMLYTIEQEKKLTKQQNQINQLLKNK